MNEWGHLEHKTDVQDKRERRDELTRATEAAQEHITKGTGDREQVERTADRIRDELMLTLEELDRRRHRALDVRFQALRHRDLLVGVAVTAAVLTGVTVGIAVWRARHRQEILARHRLKAMQRAWSHPDRVASSAEERPLPVELGRKLVMIFATALASNIAKNSVQALVPRRQAAVGSATK
ncbi:hypothetical protein [Hyalangium versicolor]|uniref:hypothetical protein n=1 Tax=Hyalangium versicolor TaxID=2861190 RepID=UPI001CCA4084|nr:hypothetical protein [Hyalangium versicolor]